MKARSLLILTGLCLAAGCNLDGAYQEYCDEHPGACADSGTIGGGNVGGGNIGGGNGGGGNVGGGNVGGGGVGGGGVGGGSVGGGGVGGGGVGGGGVGGGGGTGGGAGGGSTGGGTGGGGFIVLPGPVDGGCFTVPADAGVSPAIRAFHTATMLPLCGQVVIVGGVALPSFTPLDSVEIYDFAANRFFPGPPLESARWKHQGAAFTDGRLVIAGGLAPGNVPLQSVEALIAGRWVRTPPLARPRAGGRMFAAGSEMVVVAEGRDAGTTAELMISSGYWNETSAGPPLLVNPAAVVVEGGRALLIAGGEQVDGGLSDGIWRYTPSANFWVERNPSSAVARKGGVLAWIPDSGQTILVGGLRPGAGNPESHFIDEVSGAVGGAGGVASARVGHHVVVTSTRTIYVIGSDAFTGSSGMVERVNLAGAVVREPDLLVAREAATATLLPDDSILVVGGSTNAIRAERLFPDGGRAAVP